jgi:diacylglycerol O-acyltransferase
MQTLTNLDASFLHLEKDSTPMHVGGVLLFAPPREGAMTFERFRRHVGNRLQTARVFRQRLYTPPGFLGNPVWIEDPEFRLDNHLRRRTVSHSLSLTALEGLTSGFFSRPLRRDQPLWELMYVHTPHPEDGFALLLKVHHCALDGVSAEAVITGLLDFTPEPRPMGVDGWQPEALPTLAATVRRRAGDLTDTARLRRRGVSLVKAAASVGGHWLQHNVGPRRDRGLPRYFAAPGTPFNRPVGTEREYFGVQLSLSKVKAVKNTQPGCTVNDVVLAVCAGAVRRYLAETGELPAAPLVAMAPVSRRSDPDKTLGGNQVSSMLIRLATDIEDPVQRLLHIHRNAEQAKRYNREVPVDALLDHLPSAAPGVALTAYSRLNLARRVPPMFNLVVTNVPGSPLPLYFDGAMLKSLGGMAGIYDGMALTLVVMSYLDQLSISITTTPEAVRKPTRLARYLEEALEELAAAVLPVAVAGRARSVACA